jgi:hypothetical protein
MIKSILAMTLEWTSRLPLHQRRAMVRLWREYGGNFDPTGTDEAYAAIDIGSEQLVISRGHPHERIVRPARVLADLNSFLGVAGKL